jgi:hypothetical protein
MGLLNPEKDIKGQKHILAYITPGEADTLQDLGAEEVLTSEGIPAYPPPGEKGGPGSGAEGRAPTAEPRGTYQSPDPDPQPSGGPDIDATYKASEAYFEPTYEKTFVDKVIDYYKGGGLIGAIAGRLNPEFVNPYEGITGETDYGGGDYVSTLDDWTESRGLGDDYSALDAEGQAFIDQEAYDAGWRSPAFQELYKEGDTSNLQNLSGPETTALEQLIPSASYAVANQTPVESQVDKWFAANPVGTGLDPNYMNTYNTAKAQIANTLGMVDTSNQFGYSNDPYGGLTAQNLATNPYNIDWMQQRGLI